MVLGMHVANLNTEYYALIPLTQNLLLRKPPGNLTTLWNYHPDLIRASQVRVGSDRAGIIFFTKCTFGDSRRVTLIPRVDSPQTLTPPFLAGRWANRPPRHPGSSA